MLRADDLDTSLNGHRNFLFHVIAGACPLGGVVVGQLSHPVCKPDLHITIEGGNWKVLYGAEEGGREEGREEGRKEAGRERGREGEGGRDGGRGREREGGTR